MAVHFANREQSGSNAHLSHTAQSDPGHVLLERLHSVRLWFAVFYRAQQQSLENLV